MKSDQSILPVQKHNLDRPVWKALWRGFGRTCPACGKGRLFQGYVQTVENCTHCALDLRDNRADDAPPYFTIIIVGHIIVPLMLAVEKIWQPEMSVHFVLWLPLTALLAWWFLPRTKGATIGLQWAMRMQSFAPGPPTQV